MSHRTFGSSESSEIKVKLSGGTLFRDFKVLPLQMLGTTESLNSSLFLSVQPVNLSRPADHSAVSISFLPVKGKTYIHSPWVFYYV